MNEDSPEPTWEYSYLDEIMDDVMHLSHVKPVNVVSAVPIARPHNDTIGGQWDTVFEGANHLGKYGWEMVCVVRVPDTQGMYCNRYYFKRKRQYTED